MWPTSEQWNGDTLDLEEEEATLSSSEDDRYWATIVFLWTFGIPIVFTLSPVLFFPYLIAFVIKLRILRNRN
jgi:hypothetical protein